MKALILVFIFFSAFAYGQQKRIKGFCIDKKGKAIENAFVKVNTSPVQNSYTDKNGQYEFGLNIGDSIILLYRANDISIKRSFYISDSFFTSSFYLITGLHFSHVIIGIVLLSFVFTSLYNIKLFYLNIQLFYWHFVEIIWLVLYIVFYSSLMFNVLGLVEQVLVT